MFSQVRRGLQERLFIRLVQTHHYLGYTRPVGEHLKYLVTLHTIHPSRAWPSRALLAT
ncbi:MAG: DUF4338 domain-containing protein [Candidatus Wallbacteria bacterium]|nr:DUF4338 domain-containing protein [Candidatus Wallbacteria bacterium]